MPIDNSLQTPNITLECLALDRMTTLPALRHRIQLPARLAPEVENAMRRAAILSAFGLAASTPAP